MASTSDPASTACSPGELVRRTRKEKGWTLAYLGQLTGYSTAQVSRYERGISPMTDVAVLRCFAHTLGIPLKSFGLAAPAPVAEVRHGQVVGPISAYPRLPAHTVGSPRQEDGEAAVRRRQLLANLAVTAAAAAGAPSWAAIRPPPTRRPWGTSSSADYGMRCSAWASGPPACGPRPWAGTCPAP
ncbi:helix-turn-helix domain-containing protein [Streptomyces sp. Ac-502]|uniref:helix-turn-helix domain-containing protein n=1 Tax=Streptomyces sp. Ac-502 TaxID=3342801 RepID=UPI0038627E4D